jgi:hypothetical protein
LLDGVKALLNDPNFTGIARDLYNHALVNPLATGTAKTIQDLTNRPAYIDSRGFAVALYDTLSANAASGASPDQVIDRISDPQLKSAMAALWATSSKDIDAFKHNVGQWFDASMDRLSGWYKRRTQLVSFLVALVIAVIFNVNALYLSAQVWRHPAAMADLANLHLQGNVEDTKNWNPNTSSDGSTGPCRTACKPGSSRSQAGFWSPPRPCSARHSGSTFSSASFNSKGQGTSRSGTPRRQDANAPRRAFLEFNVVQSRIALGSDSFLRASSWKTENSTRGPYCKSGCTSPGIILRGSGAPYGPVVSAR